MSARATIRTSGSMARPRSAEGSRLGHLLRPSLAYRDGLGANVAGLRSKRLAVTSEEGSEDHEAPAKGRLDLLLRPTVAVRAGLALGSALLYALAFPPFDLGFAVGWTALVPLALAVRGLRGRHAALLGGLFGFAATQIIFGWMYRFAAFHLWHGAVLAGYLALFPAAFAVALARWGSERRGLVYVPAAGALVEWLRAHTGFLSVPWASFGQTQHRNLSLLQLAPFAGEIALGIVVVAVNVALAQLLVGAIRREKTSRAALATLGVVAALHLVLLGRLYRGESGESVTVAAVQPATAVGVRAAGHEDQILEELATLSRRARRDGAELVVWPESSVGALELDMDTKLAVRDVVEEIDVPIVLGSSHAEKMAKPKPGAPAARPSNAAFVMAPRTSVPPPYKKVRLLPFGEYRPIDLPESIAPRMFDTERGEHHMVLDAGAIKVEPIICWENLFAEDVHGAASEEPTVIAHLVNDGWFGPTAQPALHNLASVMRAAEANRPVVLASNLGPSQIIDARGRVVARSTHFYAPDVVTARVHMPGGMTPYRRFGDFTWALPLLALVAGCRRAARGPSSARRQ